MFMYGNQYGQQFTPMNNPYNQFSQYQQQQNYFANQTQQGLIKVTGLDGAKAYQMPPNSVVALFDANNDIFYVKSTDGAGFPTIRAFSFTPYNVEQPNNDYVTRTEFNQLKEMLLNGKQFVSTDTTGTEKSNADVK